MDILISLWVSEDDDDDDDDDVYGDDVDHDNVCGDDITDDVLNKPSRIYLLIFRCYTRWD
jgi:hypothetical protein